jgi:hypothetical protein
MIDSIEFHAMSENFYVNINSNSNCRIFFHNLGFVKFAKVPPFIKFAEFGGTWNFRSVLGYR